ncbi:hypothetical protein KKC1_24020 [Calderihabitans maritimus]|uniref:Uncharacterized protein n=1 Tax=Calderihabitans maritimus TaxID=1246530 RepID=A0A1Z5HUQ5_9FIRM|nr:hypothetical protein KKC1_24020 [Calderihabitans maritimus]
MYGYETLIEGDCTIIKRFVFPGNTFLLCWFQKSPSCFFLTLITLIMA